MKKTIIYITMVLILTIITVGATYAYLITTTNSNINRVTSEGAELIVNYTGGEAIEGEMDLSTDKSGGYNTTVNISISENSVVAKANLYIDIQEISSSLATEGLTWEVYKTINGTESPEASGTFADCDPSNAVKKCTAGDKLYIVTDYTLSTTPTAFTVYVWLNGHKVGNEVIGASFKGIIKAESENFTGKLG